MPILFPPLQLPIRFLRFLSAQCLQTDQINRHAVLISQRREATNQQVICLLQQFRRQQETSKPNHGNSLLVTHSKQAKQRLTACIPPGIITHMAPRHHSPDQ